MSIMMDHKVKKRKSYDKSIDITEIPKSLKYINYVEYDGEQFINESLRLLGQQSGSKKKLVQYVDTTECFTVECSDEHFVYFMRYVNRIFDKRKIINNDCAKYLKQLHTNYTTEKINISDNIFEKKNFETFNNFTYLGVLSSVYYFQCNDCHNVYVSKLNGDMFKNFMKYVNENYKKNDLKHECHVQICNMETEWMQQKKFKLDNYVMNRSYVTHFLSYIGKENEEYKLKYNNMIIKIKCYNDFDFVEFMNFIIEHCKEEDIIKYGLHTLYTTRYFIYH